MISVVIPAYDEAAVLEDALSAVFSQRYQGEYEVLVVDDGSDDSTREVAGRHPVRLIAQDHRGPAAARNRGAREAKGDILLFTDADCVPEPDWMEEMVRPIQGGVVGVQGRYRTRQKGLVPRFVQLEIEGRYELMARSPSIDFIGSYSAAYLREIFLKEGGFDETYPTASGEDPDLSYRLAAKGYRMVFNPRAVVYHRHPESLSQYLRQKFYRAYWRVPLYRKNRPKVLKDSYTPQTLKLQLLLLYLLPIALGYALLRGPLPLVALITSLFLTLLPTAWWNFCRDRAVGLASVPLLLLRDMAFALGLLWGAGRLLVAGGRT